MLEYLNNTISEPVAQNFYPNDFVYTDKDGWRVAFGLVAYDSSAQEGAFDKSYGEIAAWQKIWGELDANGDVKPTYFDPLEIEPCTLDQINLDAKDDLNDDKYDFFHPSPEFGGDVKRFYKDLLCMKKGAEL